MIAQEALNRVMSEFLTKSLYKNPKAFRPEARIREDLHLKQHEFVEMVMLVEQQFGVIIPDGALLKCNKIEDLSHLAMQFSNA